MIKLIILHSEWTNIHKLLAIQSAISNINLLYTNGFFLMVLYNKLGMVHYISRSVTF